MRSKILIFCLIVFIFLYPLCFGESMKGRISLGAKVGYTSLVMNDVNTYFIQEENNDRLRDGWSGKVENLGSAYPFSFEGSYGILQQVSVGFEVGYLRDRTKGTYTKPGEDPRTFEYEVWGTPVLINGRYHIPLREKIKVNLGIGIGEVFSAKVRRTETRPTRVEVKSGTGSAFLIKMNAGGEYFLYPQFSLGVEVGYHSAKVDEIKDELGGYIWTLPDGDPPGPQNVGKFTLDYSGIEAILAMRFYIK